MWFEKKNMYSEKQLTKWRGWSYDDIMRRVDKGLLEMKITDDGVKYAERESISQMMPRIPRGEAANRAKVIVRGTEVIYRDSVEDEAPVQSASLGFWGWFELISTIVLLPFTILGMREGVQWFLGTGRHGGGGSGDDWG